LGFVPGIVRNHNETASLYGCNAGNFPIQEFLATDEELMNPNMDEERINNPAVFHIIGDTECT
jgi:hypothetical protein